MPWVVMVVVVKFTSRRGGELFLELRSERSSHWARTYGRGGANNSRRGVVEMLQLCLIVKYFVKSDSVISRAASFNNRRNFTLR